MQSVGLHHGARVEGGDLVVIQIGHDHGLGCVGVINRLDVCG